MKSKRAALEKILFVFGCVACTVIIQKCILRDGIELVVPLLKLGFSREQSLKIYYFLFCVNLLFFILSKGREKNIYDMLLLIGFPMQMFMVMLYSNYLARILWFAWIMFLIVLIDEIGCCIRRNDFFRRNRRRFRKLFSARWSFGKIHFRAGVILCIVCCYASIAFSNELSPWTLEECAGIKAERQIDRILNVEENFEVLNKKEKVNLLQQVLDQELSYLGCEAVQLIAREFDDSAVHGYYDHSKKIVAINMEVLDGPVQECIRVCLHEAYHVYQYACVESLGKKQEKSNLKIFKEIVEWKYEFEHYSSASGESTWKEYIQYANQKVEKSAREYAETEWVKYAF